jgi:hypothetical protein
MRTDLSPRDSGRIAPSQDGDADDSEDTYTNVYIAHLPPEIGNDRALAELFSTYGTVVEARLPQGPASRLKGEGFCRMHNHTAAVQAVKALNGAKCGNSKLYCRRAYPQRASASRRSKSVDPVRKSVDRSRRSGVNQDREIGYRGEAFVYKELLSRRKYAKVVWPSRSAVPTGDWFVDCEGETMYIQETGDHFDLWAIDRKGTTTFFEVKAHAGPASTRTGPYDLSPRQREFLSGMEGTARCLVAVVENAMSDSPSVDFYAPYLAVEL